MRKKDLIKFLESVKGNPEIIVYQSSIGDWLNLDKPQVWQLARLTKESIKIQLNHERAVDNEPPLTEDEVKKIKFEDWEIGVSESREKYFKHEHKNAVVLQTKPRGISTFDRTGSFKY